MGQLRQGAVASSAGESAAAERSPDLRRRSHVCSRGALRTRSRNSTIRVSVDGSFAGMAPGGATATWASYGSVKYTV